MSQNTDNLLLSVINSKDAIKAAIEAKGVVVGSVAFDQYAGKISSIDNDPGGTLWTPAEITTSLWFDANDLTTINKDGSNVITDWNDKSGNERHASQSTSSARPIHFYDSNLEKWVVRFVSNDFLNLTNFADVVANPSGFSLAILLRRNSNKTGNYFVGLPAGGTNDRLVLGWANTITVFNASNWLGGVYEAIGINVESYISTQIALYSASVNIATDTAVGCWGGEVRTITTGLFTPR